MNTQVLSTGAAAEPVQQRWPLPVLLALGAAAGYIVHAGGAPIAISGLPFLGACLLAVSGSDRLFLLFLLATAGLGFGWARDAFMVGGRAVNFSGLHWGLIFVTGFLVVLRRGLPRVPPVLIAYLAFVGVAAVGIARTPDRFEGLKQTIQFATPALIALIALRRIHGWEDLRALRHAFWVGLVLAGVGVLLIGGGFGDGPAPGLSGALGNRPLAIFLIPLLALALAGGRYRGREYFLLAGVIVVLVAATLSRTVIGVTVILLWLASVGTPLRWRAGALIVAAALGFGALQFEPIQERLVGGAGRINPRAFGIVYAGTTEAQIQIGGLDLTGRGYAWLHLGQRALASPALGHGTGSAVASLSVARRIRGLEPHNDYIRVFHDQGLIGLAPFLVFALLGLRLTYGLHRRGRRRETRELALAAALALTGYLIVAITDNPLVYSTFFGIGVFVLIIMALRAGELERLEADAAAAAEVRPA
jgi:hypothetical protein